MCHGICVVCRSEDNWGSALSFHHVGSGVKLKVLGFVASTFYTMSHPVGLFKGLHVHIFALLE